MKKKNIILTIMLIVCVGLLAGAVYLFNDIFPKAEPIRHPELDEIVSVTLSCNTPDATIPTCHYSSLACRRCYRLCTGT